MNYDKLLTLQLRPHVASMLDTYVESVRARLPETVRAKVNASMIVRKLIVRPAPSLAALNYVYVGRKRDGAQSQLRVRVSEAEYAAIKALSEQTGAPMARVIAALIVDALHPDGNFPPNPDSKPQPTKATP